MTSENKYIGPVILEEGVLGPKEYSVADYFDEIDKRDEEAAMSEVREEVCEDDLPADRCSAKEPTCKACGGKDIGQETHGSGMEEDAWAEGITFYCHDCLENDCVCPCVIAEHCGSCLVVEPCGCSCSEY